MNMIDRELFKHVIAPAIIVAFIVAIIGAISFFIHRDMLENQLRDDLNNRILESRMEIGALNTATTTKNSIEAFKVKSTLNVTNTDPFFQKFDLPLTSTWGGVFNFMENEICVECLDLSQSEFFAKISHNYGHPALIVLKQENGRYTLYGEQPVAIIISKIGAPFLVTEKNADSILGPDNIINLKVIEDNLYSYLMNEKYPDCKFRYDLSLSDNGFYVTKKYEMLDSLQVKKSVSVGNSLYYRVNKYFELKLDDYYSYIGGGPVTSYVSWYGNNMYKLYYRTYECHFVIKENPNVLLDEYLEIFGIIGGIVVFITLAVCYYRYNKLIEKRSKAK